MFQEGPQFEKQNQILKILYVRVALMQEQKHRILPLSDILLNGAK